MARPPGSMPLVMLTVPTACALHLVERPFLWQERRLTGMQSSLRRGCHSRAVQIFPLASPIRALMERMPANMASRQVSNISSKISELAWLSLRGQLPSSHTPMLQSQGNVSFGKARLRHLSLYERQVMALLRRKIGRPRETGTGHLCKTQVWMSVFR